MSGWAGVTYMPILSLRPAEMRALEELPDRTKARLLPIVPLRSWATALRLANATKRISDAFGDRPIVIALGGREPISDRPVYNELEALRSPINGFRNWCEFIRGTNNYIPAVQLSSQTQEEEEQIATLHQLGRGLVIILETKGFAGIEVIAKRVNHLTERGSDVCFVSNFHHAGREDVLSFAAQADGHMAVIRRLAPEAYVATSASSFPSSFTGLTEQPIFERQMFNLIRGRERLIYSDRGSARSAPLDGGSGVIPPRIDYPLPLLWKFRGSETKFGFDGYQEQATLLMDSPEWSGDLRVWGTQMIERTALGDTSAISGTQKATAARINLHLQRQAFYDDPEAGKDTDEDWTG